MVVAVVLLLVVALQETMTVPEAHTFLWPTNVSLNLSHVQTAPQSFKWIHESKTYLLLSMLH